jgi:hypothetical protein
MASANPNTVSRLVEKQRRRLDAAETLERIITEFPDLISELLDTENNGQNRKKNGIRRIRFVPKTTAFARIAKVFLDNPDEWIDTAHLVKKSGVDRNSAATVLWSTHKDDFVQEDHPAHKRMKVWKLRQEAADRIRNQQQLFDSSIPKGKG